ncbi:MAG: hydrogenase expression/formation protein HypE [Deltaproteobacteria bacterium]|nr:hydrogenase expression/formation protein HypE [Deltaproteobacteria bacterium]
MNDRIRKPAAKEVLLAHGSGGRDMHQLVEGLIVPRLDNPLLAALEDQACLEINGVQLAFTTDSYVVDPIFFPGGDIGSLSVHGTVNDLAMSGARPLYLSLALILEEGFPMADLERLLESIAGAARENAVQVVTGDTKVVHRNSADKIFINTSGVGLLEGPRIPGAVGVRPGDKVLLSGSLGDHGMTILSLREGFRFDSPLASDSAGLWPLVEAMQKAAGGSIRAMRDPTRGGLATTLNEIAARSRVGIRLEEAEIPVNESVRGACEILGLDPLYVANEGKLVAFVGPEGADALLEALRGHPLGAGARCIGTVVEDDRHQVILQTAFGGSRIVDMLSGDPLPRIC